MSLRIPAVLIAAALLCQVPVTANSHDAPPPGDVAVPQAIGLMGTGLRVADLDRATAFYRDGLGLRVLGRIPLGEKEEVILGFGADPNPPFVFLVGPKVGADKVSAEDSSAPGRTVFAVADAGALHARLSAAGYAPDGIKVHKASGTILFWVTDPDGHRLEITQPGPRPTLEDEEGSGDDA